ncbi:hypothetical protein DFQ11_101773 [Winogradskyella epiphytica]|uniref:Lipocalin-like protein n=1 Tax=Winogradskyella epiphytica TaxID=262005 RepID=A0A2V4XJ41_9FLAO|nr:hypothetical protein [Winogradskyella epiphytica]PYE83340.1 hypothetical protein DFQ11_101773 [Winogradskyella epiphytica]GGW57474.1 hypothetical protein GCM10008085_06340 [Winogradskyella epiphytica]
MKKLLPLFCLFTLLTAFTCENEPLDVGFDLGENNNNNSELIGTWELVDFDVTLVSSSTFGDQSFTSDIAIISTEEDYTLNFTQNTFTTSGNYTYDTQVAVNGDTVSTDAYSMESVNGNGTYSTVNHVMTVDGSFFDFEFEGMDQSALQGEQTVTFSISNDGQTLTFSQDETTSQTDPATGNVTDNTTTSTSVWIRQ